MVWIRSEEEADEIIDNLKKRTKGKYITQGVAFNKNSTREMALLKKSLMSSTTFSGLVKELLTMKFTEEKREVSVQQNLNKPVEVKNFGNFL